VGRRRLTVLDGRALEQLIAGEAVIRLPNGERWVYLYALGLSSAFPEAGSDNTFITHLYRLLVEHKVLREHLGPGLPAVLLNAATLDPTRTFCEDCMRWVDLHADAAQS